MLRLLTFWAWIACAIAAAGCEGGDGPAGPTFDPFGADPIFTTGSEPTNNDEEAPSGAGSIGRLCARTCSHLSAACGSSNSLICAEDCARSTPPGCEAEFKAALECIVSAPVVCSDSSIDIPACDEARRVLGNCTN